MGRGWLKLEDLSPAQRAQVEAQTAGRPFDPVRAPGCAPAAPAPGPKRAPARPKLEGPSKPERDYSAHLDTLRQAGEIAAWLYKPLKLHIAPRTTYEPDFAVLRLDQRIELVEVKAARTGKGAIGGAHWEEDARVKFKAAAELCGALFVFVAVHHEDGAGWVRHEFERRPSP